jgi:hypothetical protein
MESTVNGGARIANPRELGVYPRKSKFYLRDYYRLLGAAHLQETDDVKTIASFVKQRLMPIVTGEKWIDELIHL